jgi:hypothetical protein
MKYLTVRDQVLQVVLSSDVPISSAEIGKNLPDRVLSCNVCFDLLKLYREGILDRKLGVHREYLYWRKDAR